MEGKKNHKQAVITQQISPQLVKNFFYDSEIRRNETLEHASQAIINAINELKENPLNDTKRDELSKQVKKLTGLKELRKDHPSTHSPGQATDITELQELFSRYDAIHESRIQQLEKLNEILGTKLTKHDLLESGFRTNINVKCFEELCDSVEERDTLLGDATQKVISEVNLATTELTPVPEFVTNLKQDKTNPQIQTIINDALSTANIR